ncbi:universal stress protein [uncultured Kordia sp.]|uniref:universal stress protein n=1 Tax=uncultured Kordia sp. TaxID=507699 RepID=UPI00260A891A|nr:universal stress protein [uncultured Kordia sp.]
MKKILLPTDFSENSLNAIRYALQLFKDQKCNFILLNTYTPIIHHVEYMKADVAQFGLLDAMKEISQTGLKTVQDTIEAEFQNPNHIFSRISAFNMLVSEIELLYEENSMDMVVMGTQGASGLKEVLFGSNAIHVLKSTKCPLLVIPSKYSYKVPNELLFPSDYGIDFTEKHVEEIKNIAELHASTINIMHVTVEDELPPAKENNRQQLANYFKDIPHTFHKINHHDIGIAISELQSKSRNQFLVMMNNKRSFFENLFFGSKVKRIGLHLRTPFLIIPATIRK